MRQETLQHWTEVRFPQRLQRISGRVHRIVTHGGTYILKKHNKLRHLELIYELQKNEGLPINRFVLTKAGDFYAQDGDVYYILYEELPGEPIYEGFDSMDCSVYGKAIAILHQKLNETFLQVPLTSNYIALDVESIKNYLSRKGRKQESIDVLNDHIAELSFLKKSVIHRDPHPGNIVIHKGEFSGFIDLELMVEGPRLFDIVYCSTAILSGYYPDKKDEWKTVLAQIVLGYHSQCSLTDEELELIVPMAIVIQYQFTDYYIKRNQDKEAILNAEISEWLHLNRKEINATMMDAI